MAYWLSMSTVTGVSSKDPFFSLAIKKIGPIEKYTSPVNSLTEKLVIDSDS